MCIRLNTLHEMISQKRGISEICRYFQSLNMILWPRFQLIINNHIENLKKIDPERADSGNNPLPHTVSLNYIISYFILHRILIKYSISISIDIKKKKFFFFFFFSFLCIRLLVNMLSIQQQS